MKSETKIRYFFCLLCAGFWLLTSNAMVQGARVAGEDGITPVTPQVAEEVKRLTPPGPSSKTPTQKKPVQEKEKSVQEKEIIENDKARKESSPDKSFVTIDFDNVDIRIFIKFISELTGRNFVIDKAVKGKVTIISPKKISVEEAYKVFESVLEVHGYTTVPAGSITKVVPSVQARSKDIETRLREEAITPEDKVITQLIPLKYADPNEVKKLFAPMISKSSVIVSYPPTGILIVTDVLSNIKRLFRIIRAIDVEGIGAEISVVPLEHATASVMATSLKPMFQRSARKNKKGTFGMPVIEIAADDRINALIILASENDTLRIKELIRLLDKETPRGEGDIRVYYLQHANAEDLAKVLMAIPAKQARNAKKGRAPIVSKDVQIVADKATNSLVITSNRDDYVVLEDVIRKLDIPRRMVYIEALFMEVSVDKEFDLGVRWQAAEELGHHDGKTIVAIGGSAPVGSTLPTIDPTTGTVSLPDGFSLGVMGEGITIGDVTFPSIGAVIRAFQSDSDVHILATPQIMTTDNEEAEIYVGENRPFLTRQQTTTTEIDYSNYEFKDVGFTLNIIPQINQERFVRLKISQEVSQVVSETTVGLPTTLKRLAKTTVVIKDGHSVVIGGLIDETLSRTTYEVPCLGKIPGFEWLFKSLSKSGGKSNLFIFLTPHIIENPEEAKEVYQEKKDEIDSIKEGVIKMYERP